MNTKNEPLVTICIPHWQVRELVTITLRSIRKYTTHIPIEIIVVDNGSQDDSLDYLRSLSWIRLIELGNRTPKHWVQAFKSALDVGFDNCHSEYFIIMHTDTVIKRPDWLERMLQPVQADPLCAAVGAWKLEKVHPFYELLKNITDTKKAWLWLRRTFLRDGRARQLKRELCPRDYCALYRSDPIRRFGLRFCNLTSSYKGYTAGEQMYYYLKDRGYRAEVLNTEEMMLYMEHIAHATAGLRPMQRHLNHNRAQKKAERKLRRFFALPWVQELALDSSLDE